MVHDDEIGGSYERIHSSERYFPPDQTHSDAHLRAVLAVVDNHPDWKDLPHDVYEELRLTRHDIPIATVRFALAHLQSLRVKLQ